MTDIDKEYNMLDAFYSKSIKSFFANESGATAIEYGLIAALIAVAIIAALSHLGGAMSTEFGEISSAVK